MLNNSEEFANVMGASFDSHPRLQQVTIELVEPEHQLLRAFKGKSFTCTDEPYLFKNTYKDKNFRPLLKIAIDKLRYEVTEKFRSDVRYFSWIKRYGKGRVFFSAFSHEESSFENHVLLQFYLDGLQYALGDLDCDDSVKNIIK